MTLAPADEREAAEILREAGGPFDIAGGGTRSGFGRPRRGAQLSTAKLSGIVFHEPAEMTLRARAGTPLSEVEARLAFGRLRAGFDELSEIQRQTLKLFYFEEIGLREISERLKEPLGNVRHHFYRGLERLRKSAVVERVRKRQDAKD